MVNLSTQFYFSFGCYYFYGSFFGLGKTGDRGCHAMAC